ncbi:Inner membrane protein CreD-like protein [Grimontia indica]|uniref:Inner membrane protein CreD-like protein n=1 Tax=Grimontia indica TaxID=1056512 RepID=R1GUG1_9GAMM|nr:cell envelope integrity protein CreD [Grimontia indica]EOD79818.1 Inner membrane protein CreD-like protein [Grimontia indica]
MIEFFAGIVILVILAVFGFGAFALIKSGVSRFGGNIESPVIKAKSSLFLKGVLAAILCVLIIAPLTLVQDMAWERESLYRDVVNEIGESWGSEQLLAGPVLALPYSYVVITEETNDDGERKERRTVMQDELIILPKTLDINAQLNHDFRDRGIYHSLVYQSTIEGQAWFDFELPNINNVEHVYFGSARLVFGLSANKAIDGVDRFEVTGEGLEPQANLMSGTGVTTEALRRGFHRPVTLADNPAPFTLDFKIRLRGSQGIGFLPLGETSTFNLTTDWPHPSFSGMLPTERNISDSGFSATWEISHLSRNYPQIFKETRGANLVEAQAHTQLFEPVTHYGKVERSLKYGLLFVALTFIVLLMFELSQGHSLSMLQYVMVGAAMTLFYLVLLALSEHLGFTMAYGAAAIMPILSIPAYVGSATGSRRAGLLMFSMLLGLYILLYSILRLEDYALLMGSGLLVAVLLTLMFLTRKQARKTEEVSPQ